MCDLYSVPLLVCVLVLTRIYTVGVCMNVYSARFHILCLKNENEPLFDIFHIIFLSYRTTQFYICVVIKKR